MNDWHCTVCDYQTDNFTRVWNHAKGAAHTMQLTKDGECN